MFKKVTTMKSIHLQVEDNKLDIMMTLIQNLKDDIVQRFYVEDSKPNTISEVSSQEQEDYEKILNTMSKNDREISSREIVSL